MAELTQHNTTLAAWRARLNEVMQRFKQLPNNRKILFLFALAAVFAIIVAFAIDRTASYKVLLSNVEDRDGGQIITALQQMNIPYRLGEGGVIFVPADRVYDVRLKLAAQGLPKSGGVGFELMDNQKFGISQFAEQVNYQRAIEGELARTIETMGAVDAARVHIAIPKQSVFLRDQAQTTASVMLTLYRGRVLDPGQVAGILHLVSSSVPNLSVRNVTIVDQSGNLLSRQDNTDDYSGLDQRQLGYVQQIEAGYVKQIEDILEPILGRGNARARVNISADFSQVEQTSETYVPNSTPHPSTTRSQQISERMGETTGAQATGVPGALSNQPPMVASAPTTLPPGITPGVALSAETVSTPGMLQRDITTNYEVDKTIQHTRLPQGEIKRLTAAVVVNYRSIPDKSGAIKATALTAKEMEQVNILVKEAIGYNAKRGDSLNIVNAAFASNAEPLPSAQVRLTNYVTDNMTHIVKYAVLGLVALYLLLAVIRPIVREWFRMAPGGRVYAQTAGTAGQWPVGDGRLADSAGDEAAATAIGGVATAQIEQNKRHYASNLDAVRDIVKNDPRMAAQVIREWINENE